ncbi:MAG TPA: PA14 domain-containing protein [Anaerolineae bacterium]|nr:PA14 domain-containing protein [Anaerolineae bacterium]HQI83998.1 PA14 domain-containing protein [Anaerolineae bacterium]
MMKKVLVMLCVAAMLLLTVGEAAARPILSGEITHIVQPGQNLYGIARYYGVDVWVLARANNIVNPNYIYAGQRLIIPAKPTVQPPAGVYIVKVGDTLYSIARQYGTTAWAIAQANGIYNLNYIYVGQRLLIPGAAPVTPTPPQPQPSGSGAWRGEYFNVADLSGAPAFVRNDQAVNFHWGLRSPDTRLNTDHFSVRWTRTVNFRGGVYRFTVTTDDGARLWVDGALVMEQWRVQPETTYQADLTLTPGNHFIVIEYFDDTGNATIQFSFVRLGNVPVVTPTPTTTPDPAAPAEAWLGEYFGNTQLSGKPVATRMDGQIGFEWGLGSPISGLPENYFGVRWTRKVSFFEDNYAFCAMADDGVRLYVDGVRVIDEWHASNAQSYCAEVDVTKGVHTVMVEYYEDGGNALIYVWWERR